MPSWARACTALGTFLATARPANRGGRRRRGHRALQGTVLGAQDEDKEEGAVSDVVPAPAAPRACRDAGFILRPRTQTPRHPWHAQCHQPMRDRADGCHHARRFGSPSAVRALIYKCCPPALSLPAAPPPSTRPQTIGIVRCVSAAAPRALVCAAPGAGSAVWEGEGGRRDLQSIVAQGTAIIGCVTAAWTGSCVLPHPASCLALPPCFRIRRGSRVRLARRHTHRSHTLIHTATLLISRPVLMATAHPRPSAALLHGLRPPPGCLLSHRTLSARTLHTSYITAAASFPNRPRHGALVRTTPDLALCQLYIIHTPVLRSPRRPRACLAPAANRFSLHTLTS